MIEAENHTDAVSKVRNMWRVALDVVAGQEMALAAGKSGFVIFGESSTYNSKLLASSANDEIIDVNKLRPTDMSVSVGEETIPWWVTLTYLDISMTDTLSKAPHIDHIVVQITRGYRLLMSLIVLAMLVMLDIAAG